MLPVARAVFYGFNIFDSMRSLEIKSNAFSFSLGCPVSFMMSSRSASDIIVFVSMNLTLVFLSRQSMRVSLI